MDPEEWYSQGEILADPQERLNYYNAGLSLSQEFWPYAWQGIGNARQDLGDAAGADEAFESAADVVTGLERGDEDFETRRPNAAGVTVGKCPKCGDYLVGEDIVDIEFRGFYHRHTAYVCNKCGTIIGFSAWGH